MSAAQKIELDQYDAAIRYIQKELGSYKSMVLKIKQHTGKSIAQSTLWRWFRDREIPPWLIVWLVEESEIAIKRRQVLIKSLLPELSVYLK